MKRQLLAKKPICDALRPTRVLTFSFPVLREDSGSHPTLAG